MQAWLLKTLVLKITEQLLNVGEGLTTKVHLSFRKNVADGLQTLRDFLKAQGQLLMKLC